MDGPNSVWGRHITSSTGERAIGGPVHGQMPCPDSRHEASTLQESVVELPSSSAASCTAMGVGGGRSDAHMCRSANPGRRWQVLCH